MKVIDLFNKMENDQSYKPDFIYRTVKYKYQKEYDDYKNDWNNKFGDFSGWCINMILNDEIEIIEEEKPIEKLSLEDFERLSCLELHDVFNNKINELVDTVNELKKGNE